jgi:hypothetical protein
MQRQRFCNVTLDRGSRCITLNETDEAAKSRTTTLSSGAEPVCGTAVGGTIKSRVNRARLRLTELLQLDQTDEIGPDSMTKAALQESL